MFEEKSNLGVIFIGIVGLIIFAAIGIQFLK